MKTNNSYHAMIPYMVFIVYCLIGITGSLLLCVSCKSSSLNAYKEYQKKTEILLDSIEKAHGWMDTIGESDVYSDWLEARKEIAL